MMTYTFEPIGYIRSCFKEKFGVPRQPGLVPEATATLEITPQFSIGDAFRFLETFSHIWILFIFHQCADKAWRSLVRPPRLGGNQKVGVFASRSGFRPNAIGQSAVELVHIEIDNQSVCLHLKGVDIVDGTPVLDVKPYLPYADRLPLATGGYAPQKPDPKCNVTFAPAADRICSQLENDQRPQLKQLITNILALDPRPAYAGAARKSEYGFRVWDLNIRVKVAKEGFIVETIEPV